MLGIVWIAGCSASSDRWTGSVDAVFRYRPSESSTLVLEVRPDSYSEEAGLMAEDVLLSVDGTDITNATFEQVRAALRGPVGTTAALIVKRGDELIELTVERRPVKSEENEKD